MSKLNTILSLALGLGGEIVTPALREPFTCYADPNGYATVGEMGSFDEDGRWVPAEYATMGASGPMVMRRPGAAAAPAPARPFGPAMLRPGAMATPFRIQPQGGQAPASPGVSEAQIRAIAAQVAPSDDHIRAIVQQLMQQMAPYGTVPARVAPDEALFPMGLGFVILSGGPPAVLTAGFGQVLPQRAFRGERLVLSTLRSAGASTVPVIVDTFKVGDYSQLVGGAAVPVETFAPDSFGVRLMLDGAVPGVTYTLNVSVPAAIGIPAGETITVVGTVIGRAGEAAQR